MRQLKIEDRITNRSENFQRYVIDVNKHDVMSPVEEAKVAKLARQGNQSELDKLVKANLRFVISVAKQYSAGRTVGLDDLINEGNIGLIEAAQTFDPSTGFKFISYAVWHIRKNIIKYLTDNSRTVRLPHNRVQSLNQIKRIKSTLEQKLERDPHEWEVLEKFFEEELEAGRIDSAPDQVRVRGIKEAMSASHAPISLEPHTPEDSESSCAPIYTINADPDGSDYLTQKKDAIFFLENQIKYLRPIEQEIIKSIYGIGRPTETIQNLANRLNYSRESIRQKHIKALRKMQKGVNMLNLKLDDVI